MGKGSGIAMSCGVGCKCALDPILLWLWLAVVAPIRPLAWEPPYAASVALKRKKKKECGLIIKGRGARVEGEDLGDS